MIAPEYLLRCDPISIRGNLHLDVVFDTEMNAAFTLTIVPLVPNAALPRSASARTRLAVPPGYGVQEQCLPFTAASALGVVIPSPIRFGYCIPDDVPKGCRTFRSPLDKPMADGRWADPREVAWHGWVTDSEMPRTLQEWRFTPDSQEMFDRYLACRADPARTTRP